MAGGPVPPVAPDSGRFGDLVGPNATGADLGPLDPPGLLDDPDLLQVGIGYLLCSVMSVTDIVSSQRSLSAYFTDTRH